MKIAIIDGDSIGYTVGWVKKDLAADDIMSVITAVDDYVDKIIVASGATHIMGFLGGVQPTFRELSGGVSQVLETNMKGYKESRGMGKPEWYYKTFYLITHRLRTKYGFYNVEFIEADDAVLIMAEHYRQQKVDTVMCHCDKDLKQYPGVHYDYKKDESMYISPDEAEYNFWIQMIMGDSTDDVEGIPGLGIKKAEAFLKGTKPSAYKSHVLTLYQTKFGERQGILRFAMSYNYLHILREPAYRFDITGLAPVPTQGLVDPTADPQQINLNEVFNTNKEDTNG